MPGSNGYSTDPALMELDLIGSQLPYEEDVDNNQEFYFLLNNLQKQAGRKLRPEQINALTLQWNNNQNGYLDKFRQMVLSKMGLQNTVNTQEIARNKMQLNANRIGEGMTNVAKVNLLSTIRSRLPKLENFERPIQKKSEDFKTNYWLSRALLTNPNFKSIDDIKAWQRQNGLVDDGKFGDKSLAKWNELNSAPLSVEEAVQQLRGNGRLTVEVPEEAYSGTKDSGIKDSGIKANPSKVVETDVKTEGSVNSFGNVNKPYDWSSSPVVKAWNAISNFFSRDPKFTDATKGLPSQVQSTVKTYGVHKQGGNINKFSNGGKQMNDKELQEAFVQFLILDAQALGIDPNDQQAMERYLQSLGKEGIAAKLKEFMQKMKGTTRVAALGTKLDYINKLKGNCPEGEELVYMKKGGRVCPVCQKKAEKASSGTNLKKKNAVSDFKEKRHINPSDTVHVNGQPRTLTDSQNKPLVKGMKSYSASEYLKDMKDAKKGKKDAARRVEKSDMKTAYGCGNKLRKDK